MLSRRAGLSAIAALATLVGLALPAGALADTIHLEVSPASPPRGSTITVTATGEAAPTRVSGVLGEEPTYVSVEEPGGVLNEKKECGGGSKAVETIHVAGSVTGESAIATVPTFDVSFLTYSFEPSLTLCGYLWTYVEEIHEEILARTELVVLTSPSGKEDAEKREEEERAAQAAKEKYEKEAPARRKLAEAKAREAAEHAPVTFLHVQTHSASGFDERNLYTKIKVATNKYAHVSIAVNHHKGTFHYRAPAKEGVEIPWGCNHPGVTYHYVVTAIGGSGASLKRTGRFKMASVAWCAAQRKVQEHEAETKAHEEQILRLGHKVVIAEEEYCRKVLIGSPNFPFIVAGHIYLKCEDLPNHEPEVTVDESDIQG